LLQKRTQIDPKCLESFSARSKWETERANRSNRQTHTTSKRALVSIGHQAVKLWPGILRTAYPGVNIFAHNLPAASERELRSSRVCRFHVLAMICGADSGVECYPHGHVLRAFGRTLDADRDVARPSPCVPGSVGIVPQPERSTTGHLNCS